MKKIMNSIDTVSSMSKTLASEGPFKKIRDHVQQRFKEDAVLRWIVIGGTVFAYLNYRDFDILEYGPIKRFCLKVYNKFSIPDSVLLWFGDVESEIPFGRLGYTRCLEDDPDVLEKFGIPINTEKCLRDGLRSTPGEFYPQFDLSEYDPKVTPLSWSYGPITDPGLIMPTGWYNDMSGENIEFELFCRFMKIYGYLPPSCYEELFKHCKIRLLCSNQRLIRIGDPDDKVYIIVHGAVDVYSNRIGPHKDFIRIRTATNGGHIYSLFSVIDALTGHGRSIQTIYAVSKLNTTKVLVFPIGALKDYLVRHPEYLVTAIIRLLERSYRFQYQIMHVAMQLTSAVSILDPEPLHDPPNVAIPGPEEGLPEYIKEKAIQSFINYLEMDVSESNFLRENCNVVVVDPEPATSDMDTIKSSILNRPETAYKYIYAGKIEGFYLKSNLSPLEQQTRRRLIEESVVPEPLTRFYAGDGIGSLTGILGYFNVLFSRCLERSIVVAVDRATLRKILEKSPFSVFPIAYSTVYRMSPLIRSMDFAMEWTNAQEGQYIFHKEQMCYDSYLILNGRARAYQLDSESQHRVVLEYKENDWIGAIESLLQSKRRSKTCVVIRETEFAKIPNDLLRTIVVNHSEAAQVMIDFLTRRSLKSRKFEIQYPDVRAEADNDKESRRIHSIALVPVAEALPYSLLAVEIKRHFLLSGSCTIITFEKMIAKLNKPDITEMDQFMLEMYILQEMERSDLVIFICVPRMHYWNQVCSSHSEVIFTIGCSQLPNISTIPPDFEEEVIGNKISTRRKELIILHSMDVRLPTHTKEWLYCRDWIHFHHHVRLPKSAFDFLGAISEEEIELKYQDLQREIALTSDLSRFMRWIQGKTFGVLFSSGGSRIGAQLGMLEALVEYKKIPIDMVVGTGAGFLLAACYAIFQDYEQVQRMIEKVFKDFKELIKWNWDDVTFPYMNYGQGKRLLVYFMDLFGPVQLEDAWIPICCVTTNLTSQDVRVDRSGPMWVFLRASLSHLNNSPPICDPVDQDYIVDGAHSNSLPQDIIKEYGAEYIIALNTVGGKFAGNSDTKADPNISVFRFLKKTIYSFINQFGLASPSFETVFEKLALTQTRMYAAGAEAVSNLKYVVYVRPPVEHIPSQTWRNLPTLHRTGYFYMKAILEKNPYREDIPFHVFWTNIKNTSTELARAGGRDLDYVFK